VLSSFGNIKKRPAKKQGKSIDKLKQVIDMLVNFNPLDFSVKEQGKEVHLFLVKETRKAIVLKDDGTWEYK